jgi:RNA polymerase sigma-70 factor (ECF subfamily)
MDATTHKAIEGAARNSYAQLLAFLTSRAGGDVAAAEDALSEAFAAALQQWPAQGVPEKPEAWPHTWTLFNTPSKPRRPRWTPGMIFRMND